jgi:hypothetical protein
MKLYTLTLLLLSLLIGDLSAQDLPAPILEAMKNEDMATVVIYRTPQFQASLANWAVFEGGERLCKLSNKRYMIYQRKPGDSEFLVQIGGISTWPKKKTGLEIPLEAGEVYFIKTNFKQSFTRGRVELSEVVQRTAVKELADLTQDRCDLTEEEE